MDETLDFEEKYELKKGKIRTIFMTILIILLMILEGGNYYSRRIMRNVEKDIENISNKNEQALLEFNEILEYGTELTYYEMINNLVDMNNLIENTDIKIFINNEEFVKDSTYKFETVGSSNIKVLLSNTYNYKIIKDNYKIIENERESEIIIDDTKSPIILGVKDKEITAGDTLNLLEGITAYDEVDGELQIKIEGEFDNNKVGEYLIKVIAVDKNANISKQEFKVKVKEKPVIAKTNQKRTKSSKTSKNITSSSTAKTKTESNNSNSKITVSNSSTKNGRLELATAEAKRVVSYIITPDMTNHEKAFRIWEYLFFNVATQYNQSTEAYKTNYGNEAYAALIMKQAACSGFCKAVTLMCNAAGLQSKHINANKWTHQWNTVLVDGKWIILDAQGGVFDGTVHPLEY